MAVNISDRNGRALEFAIAVEISNLPRFSLSNQSITLNLRDAAKFDSLPDTLKQHYQEAAIKLAQWIKSKFAPSDNVIIERLNDSANSVADIVFKSSNSQIEVSLKHNHEALKHPRPYSLAQACGYHKNSSQDLMHRECMAYISNGFRNSAAGKVYYSDCNSYLIDHLYADVCRSSKKSIDDWLTSNANLATHLFRFIVSTGFYKVIVETRGSLKIRIQNFHSIASPTNVVTSANANRLHLIFNNGWGLNLRIHTAASKISRKNQLSLKYDAQKTSGVVQEIILN